MRGASGSTRGQGLVEALCEQWGVVVDRDAPVMHGYIGLVVPVSRGEEPCVLKISWVAEATTNEAAALRAWDGRGAARLLGADLLHSAILLEQAWTTACSLRRMSVEAALGVAGGLLRRLAIQTPGGIRSITNVGGGYFPELA